MTAPARPGRNRRDAVNGHERVQAHVQIHAHWRLVEGTRPVVQSVAMWAYGQKRDDKSPAARDPGAGAGRCGVARGNGDPSRLPGDRGNRRG